MHTRSVGNIGEEIACKFLRRRGFTIVARNYRKNWGEIDIVARETLAANKRDVHFFEVKSVTAFWKGHSAEENVHSLKKRRIRRMIETYMLEYGERLFQFHVLCVYMNQKTRCARVKWLKNIIL
jgi:putative endonuclease